MQQSITWKYSSLLLGTLWWHKGLFIFIETASDITDVA